MRMEVHVHGTAFMCKGVHLTQIEHALRPWLDYLEVESIEKVQSLEREEPGIRFDLKEQALDMCWTGEVGRSFQGRLAEAFKALGPLTEYASEITLTTYHDNGKARAAFRQDARRPGRQPGQPDVRRRVEAPPGRAGTGRVDDAAALAAQPAFALKPVEPPIHADRIQARVPIRRFASEPDHRVGKRPSRDDYRRSSAFIGGYELTA